MIVATPRTLTPDDVAGLCIDAGRIVRPLGNILLGVQARHPVEKMEGPALATLLDTAEDAVRACSRAHRALVALEPDRPFPVETEMHEMEAHVASAGAVAALLVGSLEGDAGGAYIAAGDLLDAREYHATVAFWGYYFTDWYSRDRLNEWTAAAEAEAEGGDHG